LTKQSETPCLKGRDSLFRAYFSVSGKSLNTAETKESHREKHRYLADICRGMVPAASLYIAEIGNFNLTKKFLPGGKQTGQD